MQCITDGSVDISELEELGKIELVTKATDELVLRAYEGVLSLHFPFQKTGDVSVDFASGASEHRRLHGGAFGQPIAKALGLSPKISPVVLDMTAGLGRDAFVVASLGAEVVMVERHPIVAALLQNGLERAQSALSDVATIAKRMCLLKQSSLNLRVSSQYDMVYVDPMFPERKKKAAVKKDMAAFHQLVGQDDDADDLLGLALSLAEYRVVVKRPKQAPLLAEKTPSLQHVGKSGRFDIYTKKAIKPAEFTSVAD